LGASYGISSGWLPADAAMSCCSSVNSPMPSGPGTHGESLMHFKMPSEWLPSVHSLVSHTPPVIKGVCHFILTVMAASIEQETHCISPTRRVPDKTVCTVLIHGATINANHYSTTMGHLREANTILVCSKT